MNQEETGNFLIGKQGRINMRKVGAYETILKWTITYFAMLNLRVIVLYSPTDALI
jgi:hypothetical protein